MSLWGGAATLGGSVCFVLPPTKAVRPLSVCIGRSACDTKGRSAPRTTLQLRHVWWPEWCRMRRAKVAKVFWFFFSKKNCFPVACAWIAAPQGRLAMTQCGDAPVHQPDLGGYRKAVPLASFVTSGLPHRRSFKNDFGLQPGAERAATVAGVRGEGDGIAGRHGDWQIEGIFLLVGGHRVTHQHRAIVQYGDLV
jgi:hypothetical protein